MAGKQQYFPQADGVALKEHLESRIDGLRDQMDIRLAAIAKATDLARATIDDRLTGMNEFRSALSDTTANMVTRTELDAQLNILKVELAHLREFKAVMESKASQTSVTLAYIITFASLALSIYGMFI
jgi:hypothetical protein